MNQPRTYLWLPAYLSAVLETDNALMPSRIYEALAAIGQRLLSPIEADEYKEIENAQRGLLALRVERVDSAALRRLPTAGSSTATALLEESQRIFEIALGKNLLARSLVEDNVVTGHS
jgi:hypothetical protein